MTFKAQIKPVYFYLTRYTRPYFPFPNYFIRIKSSTDILRGFGLDDLPKSNEPINLFVGYTT